MPFVNERIADTERRTANRQAIAAENTSELPSSSSEPAPSLRSRYTFDVDAVMAVVRHEVRGQIPALEAIERMLKVIRADIADPRRPPFTALFMGPTGVGKTETVRALARGLYGDADAFCRVDMNTLSQEHYSAAITGAPPGYVGAKEGKTILDEALIEGDRGKPGIMLFDEIEKASPEVTQALLNVFDNGQMTVASGERVYNFRNTIVFMTSNIGAREIYRHEELLKGPFGWWQRLKDQLTRSSIETRLLDRLNDHFSPELVNRIDDITVFNWIEPELVEELVSIEIERLNRRLRKYNCRLQVSDESRQALAKQGFDRQYGARALRRIIRKEVEVPFASFLLSGAHDPSRHEDAHVTYYIQKERDGIKFFKPNNKSNQ